MDWTVHEALPNTGVNKKYTEKLEGLIVKLSKVFYNNLEESYSTQKRR